ncbi:hypothetical protein [Lactobacillus sp. Sy-1]|nr:hypothetical protein [Lactobacillus sp. Sy-1]MBW1606152.1 hypothetical protein [Lactobacillus sp. Sy-1]
MTNANDTNIKKINETPKKGFKLFNHIEKWGLEIIKRDIEEVFFFLYF